MTSTTIWHQPPNNGQEVYNVTTTTSSVASLNTYHQPQQQHLNQHSSVPIPANSSTTEIDVRHLPSEYGYARLLGPDFTYILRHQHIYLGRRMDTMKEGFVGIS